MRTIKLNECRPVSVVFCLGVMLSVGVVYLWSLFQQPVMDYYSWDVASVTMVPSLLLFFFPIGSIVGGKIQDKFGPGVSSVLGGVLFMTGLVGASFVSDELPQMLFLAYSVICGIGAGFAYNAALVCIQKWFPDKKGIGAGLAIAAFGGSTTIFTPVVSGLLKFSAFGENAVPMTFRVMGVLFGGLVIVFGLLIRNPKAAAPSVNPAAGRQHQYTLTEAVRYREFWICTSIMLFALASFMMINPIVKTLALTRECSVALSELTVSLTGVASIVSRILFPALSDRFGKKPILLLLMGMNVVSAAGLIFAEGIVYMILIQVAVMAYGGPVGIVSAMVTESFGTEHAGINSGVVFLFSGISALIFPRMAAVLNTATGSYRLAFMVGIIVCAIPAILVMGYDKAVKERLRKEEYRALPL